MIPPPPPSSPPPPCRGCDPDAWWWLDVPAPIDAPPVEVEVDPNPVVAQLVDVNGAVLIEVRQRRVVPFGFQRPAPITPLSP